MGAMQHVYITAHGEFSNASWSDEKAQFGVRVVFAEAESAPLMGEIFVPQTNGDAVSDFGTQTGTHGTLTKTWKARIGAVGSVENCNATTQIDFAEDVWTFLNSLTAYQWSGWRWTHVKIAAIDAAGATVGSGATYTFTTPLAGQRTNPMTPQAALALTLRANIVGRKGRGRIFLPGLARDLMDANALVDSTSRTALRASFKSYIDNVQNMAGLTQHLPIVVVMSAGAAQAVRPAEIRIGDRFDTIKSRRAQVTEVYQSTPL